MTLSSVVRHGSKVGFWNAMPTHDNGRVTRSPATWIAPVVGGIRPDTSRIRVDLPQPLGPTTAANSPLAIARSAFSSASVPLSPSPYARLTPRRSTKCPVSVIAHRKGARAREESAARGTRTARPPPFPPPRFAPGRGKGVQAVAQ